MVRITILSLLIFFTAAMNGQEVEMEKFMLDSKDLVSNQDSGKIEIVSASRNSKFLKDLPVTVYVIQREEILENGYTSLVDVLKDVPGMKVSQPGSAIDGETFLMNGLYGNYYCKVLVNDIPITPSVVSGLPIARQLPIRQAQRIEIISGPSSALYGSDAIAGVINIITNESDRPAWAQADISVGTNGYYNMNVMIGGKVGKNKNVLSYEFYGNYNDQADMNVKYDIENNYNPALYYGLDSLDYLNAPYYKGDSTRPELGRLPQSSSLLGFGMKYRGLRINYDHMSRKTHSSIGQSPNRYAYYDRGNYWGESIDRLSASYANTWNKISSTTQFSYLAYNLDYNSSFRIVYDVGDKGVLYKYAASDDISFDQILTYSVSSNLDFSGGFSATASGNLPKTNDLSEPFDPQDYRPFDESINVTDPELGSFGFNPKNFYNIGAYLQMYYKYKRFTLLAGGRWDEHSLFGSNLSPKIGLQYKISETLSIRSNYGHGFRTPSLHYVYNSLAYSVSDDNGNKSIRYESVPNPDLNAEKFRAFEIGIRHNPLKKVDFELIFMYHKLNENISGTIIPLDDELYPNATPTAGLNVVSVFANDQYSKAELYSAQINLRGKNLIPSVKLNSDLFITLSKGKEILPNGYGELNDYRNVPNWFVQFNLDFRPLKNWVIILNNIFSGQSKKRFFPAPLEVMEQIGLPVNVDGYYTLDITNRFSINRNFHAFLIMNNVTSTRYGGIDAYASLYDLKYNPQYQIAFRLGFSFTLE